MELVGAQNIAASREKVWAAIFDPEVLKQSIPGCESIEATGENELMAKVTLRVGPVKASFSGRVSLTDLVPPESCTLSGEGQGGVAGFAKGSANVRLTEESPAATLLTYEAKAEVGGKLAQLGGRLIDATARKLAGEFFVNLGRIVAPEAVETGASEPSEVENTGEAEALKPESTTEAVAAEPKTKKSWLRGLFGKSSAAALLAAGLLVPTCCLDGGHAHQFAADSFGVTCRAR
ncbi:MAG: SRPBCC family protein [Beijerinckiaceae bacterium]